MTKAEAVLKKLDEIEAEMRRITFWDDNLDADNIRSHAAQFATEHGKSPVGTLPFEHWLQAVFIPNARNAAQNGKLPASSQVSVMAMREYDYHSHVPKAQGLLELLYQFDGLF